MASQSQAPFISFRGVKKAFGEKVVYDGLDLDVVRGETLTILGPSGCGKSVMLKMLIGLIGYDEGSIVFDGNEINGMGLTELSRLRIRIAYLFQSAALFDSMTVEDNVAYGLRERFWNSMSEKDILARVGRSLGRVGLAGTERMMPSDLSGGMRKRAGLARTLALEPDVLLYDEPTTGLDPINTARINELILTIQRELGITSIVVTHDMGTAFHVANRMSMLGKGRVHMVGTPDEFRATRDPFVRAFVEGTVLDERENAHGMVTH
jgi:phospholipid/cholesterol/gamma-HCH transport system ATP-binding protein